MGCSRHLAACRRPNNPLAFPAGVGRESLTTGPASIADPKSCEEPVGNQSGNEVPLDTGPVAGWGGYKRERRDARPALGSGSRRCGVAPAPSGRGGSAAVSVFGGVDQPSRGVFGGWAARRRCQSSAPTSPSPSPGSGWEGREVLGEECRDPPMDAPNPSRSCGVVGGTSRLVTPPILGGQARGAGGPWSRLMARILRPCWVLGSQHRAGVGHRKNPAQKPCPRQSGGRGCPPSSSAARLGKRRRMVEAGAVFLGSSDSTLGL